MVLSTNILYGLDNQGKFEPQMLLYFSLSHYELQQGSPSLTSNYSLG